jgi:hypothetical protein
MQILAEKQTYGWIEWIHYKNEGRKIIMHISQNIYQNILYLGLEVVLFFYQNIFFFFRMHPGRCINFL